MKIEHTPHQLTPMPRVTDAGAPAVQQNSEAAPLPGALKTDDAFRVHAPDVDPKAPDFAGDPDVPVAKPSDAPPPPPKVRDLPDPELRVKHQNSTYKYQKFDGPLFTNGVSHKDVAQGAIGDCYLMGSMASVAYSDPDRISKMIKDNGDGTYTVTFQEQSYSGYGTRFKPVSVTVDSDLPVSGSGKPAYAKSKESEGGKMELWVSVVEKAYAQWKGGYDDIGEGGNISKSLEAFTGRPSRYTSNTGIDDTRLFSRIRAAAEGGHPMAAVTFGEDQADLYKGVGIYPWHTYTVLGAQEENGVRYVQLRNPWGSGEPGSDGADDGIFRIPMADFRKFYEGVIINDG